MGKRGTGTAGGWGAEPKSTGPGSPQPYSRSLLTDEALQASHTLPSITHQKQAGRALTVTYS